MGKGVCCELSEHEFLQLKTIQEKEIAMNSNKESDFHFSEAYGYGQGAGRG